MDQIKNILRNYLVSVAALGVFTKRTTAKGEENNVIDKG